MENYWNIDVLDGGEEVSKINCGSRKRKKRTTLRETAKVKKYSTPSGSNVFVPCNHLNHKLQCKHVRPRDAKEIRNKIYKDPVKLKQDVKVSHLIQVSHVKRRRPRKNVPNNADDESSCYKGKHAFSAIYFIPSAATGKRIPVCKKFFTDITKIGRTRLANIVKSINTGEMITENRGGDRKSQKSVTKKQKVREFISSLKASESHYNRKKSKRVYLNSQCSISKLHKVFLSSLSEEDSNLKVSFAMFRNVFVREFNIGFRTPASDVCSTCLLLKEKIKRAPPNSQEKNNLMVEKTVHKRRARAFYDAQKEEPDEQTMSLCFDLEQIQPLPKTCAQEAFYLRQINFYAMVIVDLKAKQPIFYTWTDVESGKGSTEVSSALLCHLEKIDYNGKTKLRLFCDGCGAQNKNNIVVQTLAYYMHKPTTQLEEIMLYFPVRGHSFLPADRVFGRVEKILRKKTTILSKDEYVTLYKNVGEVKQLGEDWNVFDSKSKLSNYFRNLENISNMKRIFIKKNAKDTIINNNTVKVRTLKVGIKGLQHYRFAEDVKYLNLYKKTVTHGKVKNVQLETLPLQHAISDEKKKDVKKLLGVMFGPDWENLPGDEFEFYKNILQSDVCVNEEADCDEADCDNACDCLEEDIGVRV